uniref:Uncharacterized protein n=1 Tax=Clastoptera arizonana TaxID=38151 RepID=A0A1B6DJ44_9HEMI
MAYLLSACVLMSVALIQVTNVTCMLNKLYSTGMDCNLGTSKNFIDKFIHTCPRIFDKPSEEYCCYTFNTKGEIDSMSCCDLPDFVISAISNVIIPVIIVIVVISLLCTCVCCLCCKRSRGGSCV